MAKMTRQQRDDQRAAWLQEVEARLQAMSADERRTRIEELITDFFVDARATLVKWSRVTGQSAQIDTGYIAQHLASLVLQIPGQGFKGKGVDLGDGSEVKSASIVSGIDRPRWNHNMGTAANDLKREEKGVTTKGQIYLNETPCVFYVLFDRVHDEAGAPTSQLRVRGWCINARTDKAWRSLFSRYLEARKGNTYNLQLHPPVGYDDSLVVNEMGNLDMAKALVLDVRFELPESGEAIDADWQVAEFDIPRGFKSDSVALEFVSRGARPSRLEDGLEGLTNLENLQLRIQDEDAPTAANESGVSVAVADASALEELPDTSEEP
jgi:MamI restriction endonuclease